MHPVKLSFDETRLIDSRRPLQIILYGQGELRTGQPECVLGERRCMVAVVQEVSPVQVCRLNSSRDRKTAFCQHCLKVKDGGAESFPSLLQGVAAATGLLHAQHRCMVIQRRPWRRWDGQVPREEAKRGHPEQQSVKGS
ncbi:hypothetical protein O3P69_004277 [Scylla paramamosain]|uniref:Uncharacterized protein n=2 Tax=Scylla paramamosain TaxID=85552 RepID=A0AAW0UJV3_SCYPA